MNYQQIMEDIISEHASKGERPKLLLHSCCAPCSSYVLSAVAEHFDVTVFYYNPNIYPEEEYIKRLSEQKRLLSEMELSVSVPLIEGGYNAEIYEKAISGYEDAAEGGERCNRCIALRLRETALKAKEGGFTYFTTTLSVSPHKNAAFINECGKTLEKETGVKFLPADFKKKDGYKKSIELSKKYNLYRQNYCGCKYSDNELTKTEE